MRSGSLGVFWKRSEPFLATKKKRRMSIEELHHRPKDEGRGGIGGRRYDILGRSRAHEGQPIQPVPFPQVLAGLRRMWQGGSAALSRIVIRRDRGVLSGRHMRGFFAKKFDGNQ